MGRKIKQIATILSLVLFLFGNAQIMVQYELEMKAKKGDATHQKEMFILAIDIEHQKSIFENAEVFNRRNIEKPIFFTEFGIDQHLYHKVYKDFLREQLEDYVSIANRWCNISFNFPKNKWKLLLDQKK